MKVRDDARRFLERRFCIADDLAGQAVYRTQITGDVRVFSALPDRSVERKVAGAEFRLAGDDLIDRALLNVGLELVVAR